MESIKQSQIPTRENYESPSKFNSSGLMTRLPLTPLKNNVIPFQLSPSTASKKVSELKEDLVSQFHVIPREKGAKSNDEENINPFLDDSFLSSTQVLGNRKTGFLHDSSNSAKHSSVKRTQIPASTRPTRKARKQSAPFDFRDEEEFFEDHAAISTQVLEKRKLFTVNDAKRIQDEINLIHESPAEFSGRNGFSLNAFAQESINLSELSSRPPSPRPLKYVRHSFPKHATYNCKASPTKHNVHLKRVLTPDKNGRSEESYRPNFFFEVQDHLHELSKKRRSNGHSTDPLFVPMKDAIKETVKCYEDIPMLAPDVLNYIFKVRQEEGKLGEWVSGTPEENLAKIMEFCRLIPGTTEANNSKNQALVDFYQWKRLLRRILATNEGSVHSDYLSYSIFACEEVYLRAAKMVCEMDKEASMENIPKLIKKTFRVGEEVLRQFQVFLATSKEMVSDLQQTSSPEIFIEKEKTGMDSHTAVLKRKESDNSSLNSDAETLSFKKARGESEEEYEIDDSLPLEPEEPDLFDDFGLPMKDPTPISTRGDKRFLANEVTLDFDGKFYIDDVFIQQIDLETMAILKNAGVNFKKIKLMNNGNHCYPWFGSSSLHMIVSSAFVKDHFAHFQAKGFTGTLRNLVVAHLDDNVFNFNKSNLMCVPRNVNRWLMKVKGASIIADSVYCSSFTCLGNMLKSPYVDSEDEALFLRDVYKVCMVPNYAKEIVFQYGLNRPKSYAKHYNSLKTLLACAPSDLTERINRPKRKYKVSSKRLVVELSLEEAPAAIIASLEASDFPYDYIRDMILRYYGPQGAIHDFIIERSCFNLFIKEYDGNFSRPNGSYICIGKQRLHLKVLGRDVGQSEEDGIQGCHGHGGVLDNRKRTLMLGSASLNSSHILRFRADRTIPVGVGYRADLKAKPWISYIGFNGEIFHLYCYPTKEEATVCYQSVQSKRDEILSHLTDMNDKQERRILVRSYVSNPNPVLPFSSEYPGVTWVSRHEKWRAQIGLYIQKKANGFHLGYFVEELEAKYVYDCVNAHRAEIKALLKDIADSKERTALVKSYIPKHIDIEF